MKTIAADKLRKNWSLLDLARRVIKGIDKDHCVGHSAEVAFFFLFALFPCLLSLTSLLAYLPVPDLVEVLLRIMGNFVPDAALSLVEKNLQSLVTVQKGGLLSFGVLLALWSASSVKRGQIYFRLFRGRPWPRSSIRLPSLSAMASIKVVPPVRWPRCTGRTIASCSSSLIGSDK